MRRDAILRSVLLRDLRADYPRLWDKLVAFTWLNLLLQLVPIAASMLTAVLLAAPFEVLWSDALILVAFSWVAAPSFLDQFSWSERRRARYATVAQATGMILLFAVLAARGLLQLIASMKAAAGSGASSEFLLQRLTLAERFATTYLAPSATAISLIALYLFLIHAHKRLLTKVGLRLRWHHQAQFAGFYVAKAKGLFEMAGLDVAIKERDLSRPLINIVGGREDEFGILMASELVQGVNEGRDLVAVEIISLTPAHELLVNRESIKIRREQGLPIRALSVQRYIEGAMLQSLLAEQGIHTTTMQVDFYSDNHGAQEFLTGQYDVIVVHRANEKLYLQREMSMANWVSIEVINPQQLHLELWGETLVTSEALAKDRPEIVAAMRSASLAGWDLAAVDREFAAGISFEYLRQSASIREIDKPQMNLQHQRAMLGEMIYMYTKGRDIRGRQTERVWRGVVESCKKAGLIEKNATVSPEKILGA
jgi:NitT/TauT family transport system substrate-binding protein